MSWSAIRRLIRPSCVQPLLGNIHAGENLQTRHQGGLHVLGNVVLLQADAIDAVSDPHAVGHGLDVNIAGPHVVGGIDDEVHQPDDGPVIGRGRSPGTQGLRLSSRPASASSLAVASMLCLSCVALLLRSPDPGSDPCRPGSLRRWPGGTPVPCCAKPDRVHHVQVHRIANDQLEPSILQLERNDIVPLDQILRDEIRVPGES